MRSIFPLFLFLSLALSRSGDLVEKRGRSCRTTPIFLTRVAHVGDHDGSRQPRMKTSPTNCNASLINFFFLTVCVWVWICKGKNRPGGWWCWRSSDLNWPLRYTKRARTMRVCWLPPLYSLDRVVGYVVSRPRWDHFLLKGSKQLSRPRFYDFIIMILLYLMTWHTERERVEWDGEKERLK